MQIGGWLWCFTCTVRAASQDWLPRKTIIQDVVRGRVENLTRLHFKIISEKSNRVKFFFCSRVIQFHKSSITFITILNCLGSENLRAIIYYQYLLKWRRQDWSVRLVRKKRKGLRQEAGLVWSRSYNFVTKACQVSTNLSKCLLRNYIFYFVPVQLFALIFVVFVLLPYGSSCQIRPEISFLPFLNCLRFPKFTRHLFSKRLCKYNFELSVR